MKIRILLSAMVIGGMSVTVPRAEAVISLSAAGAALSNFAPGKTATGTGGLTATDTNPSWTLQAMDSGTGAGKMVAGTTGCAGSSSPLNNPLTLSVTSSLGGVTSAGQVTLSSSNQVVASATSQLLVASILNTNYSQVIPPSQVMRSSCVYSITVTYTLQ